MNRARSLALGAGVVLFAGWAARKLAAARYSFAGKVCLITGGSRGLGLVLARQICAEGGRVALLARNLDELRRAHDDVLGYGGEAVIVPCDLTDRAQIEAAVRNVVQHYGRIDVLINNAGIIEVGPLEHMTRQDFEQAMQVHFWGSFTLMWEIIPLMRRQGGGRIVNITSIGGKIAVPHLAPYCSSKFALAGLSDSVRAELARDRIYVTTVAPGMMRTGSHVNAKFKGRHAEEFAFFALGNAIPLISMNAERAAAKILDGCRLGQPAVTLTVAAYLAIAANAIFPNLTGYATRVANRFLPRPTDTSGDVLRSGAESRSRKLTPEWLTRRSDAAIARNNEAGGNGAG